MPFALPICGRRGLSEGAREPGVIFFLDGIIFTQSIRELGDFAMMFWMTF